MKKCECCKTALKPNEKYFGVFCAACYQDITHDYYNSIVECKKHKQLHPSNKKCPDCEDEK